MTLSNWVSGYGLWWWKPFKLFSTRKSVSWYPAFRTMDSSSYSHFSFHYVAVKLLLFPNLLLHRIYRSVSRRLSMLRPGNQQGDIQQCSCTWMDGTDLSTVTHITQITHVRKADLAPSGQLSGEPSLVNCLGW